MPVTKWVLEQENQQGAPLRLQELQVLAELLRERQMRTTELATVVQRTDAETRDLLTRMVDRGCVQPRGEGQGTKLASVRGGLPRAGRALWLRPRTHKLRVKGRRGRARKVQLGPRTPKPMKSPRIGHRLNMRRWLFPVRGESTVSRGQVPSRALEAVGNPPHANHLNTPAGRLNTPAGGGPAAPVAAGLALLAGRRP